MKNNAPGFPPFSYCHKPLPKAAYDILLTYFKHLVFSVLLSTGLLLLPMLCSAHGQSLPVISVDDFVLQVYPVDLAGEVLWGQDFIAAGASSNSDGQANTAAIIAAHGNWNNGQYAAKLCDGLHAYGYADWYLPSVYELVSMYNSRDETGGFSMQHRYWASTEQQWNAGRAVALDFSTGIVLDRPKGQANRVRCVRKTERPQTYTAIYPDFSRRSGDFIAVARYRINDRGEAGLVFASNLLGVFNAASFANSIAQFAGEVIMSEIKKSAIKFIISSAYDETPVPAYVTILFPIRGENKPVEPKDIVFVQEYAGKDLLPLGYPMSLTYRMVDENESSPVLVIANSYDLFPLDDGAYDYLPVDLASRGNHTTLASDKTFQTFGVVSKYKEYLGKTMLILKQYEHYNYGFASGTGLNFLAIKVSDHSQDVPAPGSIIKINGTTKNLSEIGQGRRIRIEETPWYNVKSAKYVEAHTMQVVSGSRMPKTDIVYDESIFSFYYDSNVYQAVVVDLSKASKQGIKGDDGYNTGTFTDPRDGQTYRWVRIGDQVWMAENLRSTKYRNGDPIFYADNDEWYNIMVNRKTLGAYGYLVQEKFNDFTLNGQTIYGLESNEDILSAYGVLYNGYAVIDSRGLCPEGWHLPAPYEWKRLIDYVVNQGFPNEKNNRYGAGNALKSCRQLNSPYGKNCNVSSHPLFVKPLEYKKSVHYGFDAFGFSALPAGAIEDDGGIYGITHLAAWWSSFDRQETEIKVVVLRTNFDKIFIDKFNYWRMKYYGFSVRCVKTND